MTTALATTQKQVRSLIEGDKFKQQVAAFGHSIMTPERFTRVALTALNKTPELAECSQSSLFAALLDCASLGLEPDGRRAHLIPYGKTCQLIVDYKGLIELAKRSGDVRDWKAILVYEGEEFTYGVDDTGEHVRHTPDPFGEADRKLRGGYSLAILKDGSTSVEFMSAGEIDAIKRRSKASGSGPWKTDENEMRKKTIVRKHSKRLTLSPEFRDALDKDADKPKDITDEVVSDSPWDTGGDTQPATQPATMDAKAPIEATANVIDEEEQLPL